MVLAGLQKLTLLDYPGKVACTLFLGGCDLRCPFCHNHALLSGAEPGLTEQELYGFLDKRAGILEGICITGGEPLLQPELPALIRAIRKKGWPVKLDTNGTHPEALEALLKEGLLSYVAMDVKNCPARYGETAGAPVDTGAIEKSMALLRRSGIPYEFRTTVVGGLHTAGDLRALAAWLRPEDPWFLQQFRDPGNLPHSGLYPWDEGALRAITEELKQTVPGVRLRGL